MWAETSWACWDLRVVSSEVRVAFVRWASARSDFSCKYTGFPGSTPPERGRLICEEPRLVGVPVGLG